MVRVLRQSEKTTTSGLWLVTTRAGSMDPRLLDRGVAVSSREVVGYQPPHIGPYIDYRGPLSWPSNINLPFSQKCAQCA